MPRSLTPGNMSRDATVGPEVWDGTAQGATYRLALI